MAQRAFSYNTLQQLCIDGVAVTVRRGEQDVPIYRILGGAEGDEGEGDGSGTDNGSEGQGSGDDSGDGENGDSSDKSSETISREEFDKLTRRMQAADKRASEAEKKVSEYEDKDKSATELAEKKAEALEKENAKLQAQLRDTSIRNAFLADNSVTWHDPALAFREIKDMLDDDVELDSNGKIPGLADKIKKLAKDKAWMVKREEPEGSSGERQNGKRKGDDGKPDKDALRKNYPALRR